TLLTRGCRVEYVPITVDRRTGRSTVTVGTGVDTIVQVIRIVALFAPLRVFVPASAIIALSGLAWGIPYAVAGHVVSVGSVLSLVTALVLFALGILRDQISQLRLEQ